MLGATRIIGIEKNEKRERKKKSKGKTLAILIEVVAF